MLDVSGIKYYVDEDKWYKYKGVKPPERTSHGVSEDNIEQIIAQNGQHPHIWRQKGNYIYCREGEHEHGKNIGVFQRLTGTSKRGEPILVKI
jgi:hypothetical protein